MSPCNPASTALRRSSLALACATLFVAAPVWAGNTCEMNDDNPATHEVTGGSVSVSGSFACGNNDAGRANESSGLGYAFGTSNRAVVPGGSGQLAFDLGGGSSLIFLSSGASAFGIRNDAVAMGSSAFGMLSKAEAIGGSAFGLRAITRGKGSVAMGGWYDRDNNNVIPLDVDLDGDGVADVSSETTAASGLSAVAVGAGVRATADYSSAFGVGAIATAQRSTAIGFGSVADRENTLSVGAAGAERQIVNVAAGTQATDAVNLSQLQSTLATANAYTDTAVATGGTAANAYTDNREAVIRGDMDAGDATTLQSAQDHAEAGDAQTLSSANAYTDDRFAAVTGFADDFNAFRNDVDRRFQQQNELTNRSGAMGSAMVNMGINAAGAQGTRGRIAVGAGFQGGERALSVGYGRRVGQRGSFSLGGAFSGSESSAGVGFGLEL